LIKTERRITQRGLEESATKMIPAFSTVIVARGATTGRLTMLGTEKPSYLTLAND
jgi:type I restriction enzyme S subunit